MYCAIRKCVPYEYFIAISIKDTCERREKNHLCFRIEIHDIYRERDSRKCIFVHTF